MKIQVTKYVLLAITSLLLSSGWALCADTSPDQQATPGTSAAQDSKTQQNDPNGPNHQKTADTPPNTKDEHNVPPGPAANGTDQAQSPATKTPQAGMPPSTNQ